MKNIDIIIVAAVAENGVIGQGNVMPWHLGSDFKRFKVITRGKPQVMGRKTFESIGKPLPGRTNIIVTRDPCYSVEGCLVANSLEEAIDMARADAIEKGVDEICIQGGGDIYRQALVFVDRLHITHVEAMLEGDTVFPVIDPAQWTIVNEEKVPSGENDDYSTHYVVYRRVVR